MKGQFEKEIASKLYNHTASVSEGMFEAILKQRKRKKAIVWWYSGAATVLLGLIVGISYFSNQSDNLPTNSIADESTIETPVINEVENQANNRRMEDKLESLPTNDRNEASAPVSAENATVLVIDETAIATPVNRQPAPREEANPQGEIDKQEYKDLFNKIVSNNELSDENPGRLFVRDREIESDKIVEPNWKDKQPKIDVEKTDEPNEVMNPVEITRVEINDSDTSASSNDPDLDEPPLPLPKWSVDVIAGPGFASRSISGNSPEVETRNNAESAKIGYMVGAKINYHMSSKWAVGTGVYMTTRNENFDYSHNYTSSKQRDTVVTETVIHPVLGTFTREKDSTITETYTQTNEIAATNTYRQLFIPIEIERTIGLTEKWEMMAKVGGLLGINQFTRGTGLNANLEPTDLNDLPYKKSGIQSVSAGFGFAYKIDKNVSAFVYPQGNISLNSSMLSSYATKQREYGIYTAFGLRIKF